MIPMSAPLVGVSACVKEINTLPFHTVNQRYLMAIADVAGCVPIVIPALGQRLPLDELIGLIDGLVLTGSPSNVEPHLYGQPRAAEDILHDPSRDDTTLPLIRMAVERGIPLFAICRGIQELNVAYGGTLHQFLHQLPGKRDHRSDKSLPIGQRARLAHSATLTAGGVLARLAGTETVMINSLHGQAIDRLGEGLEVEAMSDDGVVEAVRVAGAKSFALGVQWHPEALCHEDRLSQVLFEAFGEAARLHASRRLAAAAA